MNVPNEKNKRSFFQQHREKMLLLIDATIVILAYCFGFFFMFHDKFIFEFSTVTKFLIVLPIVTVVYILLSVLFSLHESLWKYFGIYEIQKILYMNVVAMFLTFSIMLCLIIVQVFQITDTLDQVSFAFAIIFSSIFVVLGMFSVRFIYRMIRDRKVGPLKTNERALIIGAGAAGYLTLKKLVNDQQAHVVGFIDDNLVGKIVAGIRVLGTTKQIEDIVTNQKIDTVYLAMPSVNITTQKRILEELSDLDIKTKIMHKTLHDDHVTGSKVIYPINDVSIEDLLSRGAIKLNTEEINTYLASKIVLVTGAGGSIGSELCRQVLKFKPKQLLMLDVNENELYMLERELKTDLHDETEMFSLIVSIRDLQALDEVMKQYNPNVVFHAAAHKHVPLMELRPQEAIKNNVVGTRNVIDMSIKHQVERFVLISTDKAVNPTNVMGASKRLTELLLQSRGNNGVTKLGAVRFGNVLGSNGSVIPIFKEQIKNGGPVTITHQDIKRYFMTIPEATQLVLQAGFYADKGEIYVLDMGQQVKIIDLAKKMIKLSGYRPNEDIKIKEVGLRPGEKMFEELNLDSEKVDKTKHELIFETDSKYVNRDILEKQIQELVDMSETNTQAQELKAKLLTIIQSWNN